MSRDGDRQTAEWSQQKLAALRHALEEGQTPAGLARLLADPQLRAAFLDGLQIREQEPSAALPGPASGDVSFLASVQRKPSREVAADSGAWKMQWRRPAEEIAGLFSFLAFSPIPTLREAAGFLEDETVTLLRGKVSSRGMELDVTLEATRPAAQPDELQLSLWVLASNQSAARRGEDYTLLATVTWGSYEAQVTITNDGHYPLPPRAIASVVDDSGQSAGDLSVIVQQKP